MHHLKVIDFYGRTLRLLDQHPAAPGSELPSEPDGDSATPADGGAECYFAATGSHPAAECGFSAADAAT